MYFILSYTDAKFSVPVFGWVPDCARGAIKARVCCWIRDIGQCFIIAMLWERLGVVHKHGSGSCGLYVISSRTYRYFVTPRVYSDRRGCSRDETWCANRHAWIVRV
jgi:hypothetical protein